MPAEPVPVPFSLLPKPRMMLLPSASEMGMRNVQAHVAPAGAAQVASWPATDASHETSGWLAVSLNEISVLAVPTNGVTDPTLMCGGGRTGFWMLMVPAALVPEFPARSTPVAVNAAVPTGAASDTPAPAQTKRVPGTAPVQSGCAER